MTVGAQMPFPRLVRLVDQWAGERGVEVFAQTGDPAFRAQHITAVPWLRPDAFRRHLEGADAVIAHAGMGSILSALELGKRLLVMPRLGRLAETRNDHQVATARRFAERGWVRVAYDERDFAAAADALREGTDAVRVPAVASQELVTRIRGFVLRSSPAGHGE